MFERGRGERPHGGTGDAETGDGSVTLSEGDVQRLAVLFGAVELACTGELGGFRGATQDRTPTALRRVWSTLLKHAGPVVERVEAAHPLDGDAFVNGRTEIISRLARETEEAES